MAVIPDTQRERLGQLIREAVELADALHLDAVATRLEQARILLVQTRS